MKILKDGKCVSYGVWFQTHKFSKCRKNSFLVITNLQINSRIIITIITITIIITTITIVTLTITNTIIIGISAASRSLASVFNVDAHHDGSFLAGQWLGYTGQLQVMVMVMAMVNKRIKDFNQDWCEANATG